jgi:2-oxoglutarate dehydrogenase E1 component
MTPKSLLRHPLSVSRLEEIAGGGFYSIIDEVDDQKAANVTRLVFCSGKVYFDLLKARREHKLESVAIVRVEQLYPFPSDEYEAILRKYSNAKEIIWCQEEPQNQGAWYQIRHRLQSKLDERHELLYAGRAGAAAPATGIAALHDQQQKNLVTAALQGTPPEEASRQTMRLPAAAQTRTGS